MEAVKRKRKPQWTLRSATNLVGTLSAPSKMPGYAYGLPAIACKKGAVLHKIKGSVCENCYALKGNYRFDNVKSAQAHRLKAIEHPLWASAMTYIIQAYGETWFRWHDSGDLQSTEHLRKIIEVAWGLPKFKFWLPTRENKMVSDVRRMVMIPKNLTIRQSDMMIGAKKPAVLSSGVAPKSMKDRWPALVAANTPKRFHCPSSLQDNMCKSCRACWNPKVERVIYLEH